MDLCVGEWLVQELGDANGEPRNGRADAERRCGEFRLRIHNSSHKSDARNADAKHAERVYAKESHGSGAGAADSMALDGRVIRVEQPQLEQQRIHVA